MFPNYDGSWTNDPLDLRCIRSDAELEECQGTVYEEPTTFKELQTLSKNPEYFSLYKIRKCPPEQLSKEFIPCDILDKNLRIVDNTCHNPSQAYQRILNYCCCTGEQVENYAILDLDSMHCIPFYKVKL